MEEINKIKEFVKENNDGWVVDWNYSLQLKYYVFFTHGQKKYKLDSTIYLELPGVVYMSENCAKLLVEKLNSEEIIL
jgi:hypothetical protein